MHAIIRHALSNLHAGCLLSIGVAAVNVDAATMTFTPDRDTAVSQAFPSLNFGHSELLGIGGTTGNNDARGLFGFNVSGLGSQPILVQSITLRLFPGVDQSNGATITPEVHAISSSNRNWVEGDGGDNGSGAVGLSVWTQKQNSVANWAGGPGLGSAGIDYDATVLKSRTLAPGDIALNSPIDFVFDGTSAQLTALITGWLVDNITLNQPNPGLLIFDPNFATYGSGNHRLAPWFSNPDPDVVGEFEPQLIVEYSVVPEPSSIGLALLGGLALLVNQRKRAIRSVRESI